MKECPRCGSSLSSYSLSDVQAYGCDSCGWVGVPVDHQSEPKRLESWQDAIQRFQKKFAADGLEEHAERLERVEQARRDAVSDDVDEAVAESETVDDEPGVDEESGPNEGSAADAGGAPDEESGETDDAAAESDDDGATDDGSDPEEATDADEPAASDDDAAADDDGDEADDDGATDDEVEVAADGAGQ